MYESKRIEKLERLVNSLTKENQLLRDENNKLKEQIEGSVSLYATADALKKQYEDAIAEAKKERDEYQNLVNEVRDIKKDFSKTVDKAVGEYGISLESPKYATSENLLKQITNRIIAKNLF